MVADTLESHLTFFSRWLHRDALPMWWREGADKTNGGYVETIALNGEATAAPRRARVQPRQIYCYGEAGAMGWKGPWKFAVHHGLSFFDKAYKRPDGLYGALASAEGSPMDQTFDLYNQAFALFAFAQVASTQPGQAKAMSRRAEELVAILRSRFAHPTMGFEEAEIRKLPLCSNPHMHLFEASLAWEALSGRNVGPWSALADEIARLCMERFIDPRTGALSEFFDGNWQPFPGEKGIVVEPGHQFEWAWLLARWGALRGNDHAVEKARRLFEIGQTHGICAKRKVAVMTLNADLSVADPIARLWPQTEWMKAGLRLAVASKGAERQRYIASVIDACAALRKFLDVPVAGLWRDKLKAEGSFVEEPAPASSFYHIVCAIRELESLAEDLEDMVVFEPAAARYRRNEGAALAGV